MATESITHAFHFEGEAALRFANAVEESLKGPGLAANLTTEDIAAIEKAGETKPVDFSVFTKLIDDRFSVFSLVIIACILCLLMW